MFTILLQHCDYCLQYCGYCSNIATIAQSSTVSRRWKGRISIRPVETCESWCCSLELRRLRLLLILSICILSILSCSYIYISISSTHSSEADVWCWSFSWQRRPRTSALRPLRWRRRGMYLCAIVIYSAHKWNYITCYWISVSKFTCSDWIPFCSKIAVVHLRLDSSQQVYLLQLDSSLLLFVLEYFFSRLSSCSWLTHAR